MAPGGVDPGDTVRYRDATPEDMPFLREMTYEAAFWRDHAPRPSLERALANEDIARYLPRFGARGDITVVAERDGRPVGAGWLRPFPRRAPAMGSSLRTSRAPRDDCWSSSAAGVPGAPRGTPAQ